MSAHDRFSDDLAAYLLDALPAGDRRRFEQHLRDCAVCRAEERWLRAAVELLPSSVEQLEPPPALRERLMDTVYAETATTAPEAERPARPRRHSLAALLRPALRPAIVLAATAVLGAGVAGYLLADGDDPAVRTVAAQPTAAEPGARARIEQTDAGAILRVERLPVQRAGHIYEVWLVRRGERAPKRSSLFAVDRSGRGATAIPGGLEDVETVMVTLEPEGGSDEPTTKPLLVANL